MPTDSAKFCSMNFAIGPSSRVSIWLMMMMCQIVILKLLKSIDKPKLRGICRSIKKNKLRKINLDARIMILLFGQNSRKNFHGERTNKKRH